MNDIKGVKWYFKTPILVIVFLCVGPFVLPLIWLNPQYDKKKKVVITAVVLVVTYGIWVIMADSFKHIAEYYKQLGQF